MQVQHSSQRNHYMVTAGNNPAPQPPEHQQEPQDEVELGRTMPAVNPFSVGVGFSFGGGIGAAVGAAAGGSTASMLVGAGVGAVILTGVLGALTSKISIDS